MQKINTLIFAKESYNCFMKIEIYLVIEEFICSSIVKVQRVSEKVVRRIMKQEDLMIRRKCRQKYNSYKGEITPAVENVIDRNFHATKPNQK